MRKRKLFYLGILLVFGLLIATPVLSVRAEVYDCPTAAPGTEKVFKVTTVDNESLTSTLGENWSTYITGMWGGEADEFGAKWKSEIVSINGSDTMDVYKWLPTPSIAIEDAPICNITVHVWEFTTNESFSEEPTLGNASTFVLKDPANLTSYANQQYFSNVTWLKSVWLHTDLSSGIFLAQLPKPPADYLASDDLVWAEDWSVSGKQLIHDAPEGFTANLGTTVYTFADNCTEKWTYYDNGALIGYKIQDDTGKTIYEFQFELPEFIPGYNIPIVLGFTALGLAGVILIMKRKR